MSPELLLSDGRPDLHVVAYDFGIKHNILRMLSREGCRVTVVPAQTAGRRRARSQTRRHLPFERPRAILSRSLTRRRASASWQGRKPIFGICLGHQLIGLALGGKTYKLKFGHHGGNHPVQHVHSGKVEITAHNHNFAVDPDSSTQSEVELTHVDLNDNTLEGLRHQIDATLQRAISPGSKPRSARFELPVPRLPQDDGGVERAVIGSLES